MSSNTLIFLVILAIGIGLTFYFVRFFKKEKKNFPTPSTTPTKTPQIQTPTPTPTISIAEPEKCSCYVLSNVGQNAATFTFIECQHSGVLERTLLPGQVEFVCAKLNSVLCSDLNGTYSQAWGEDCPNECKNHL